LLKNDGKKFIEMMEQLAERRMQREEEATSFATPHPTMQPHRYSSVHNHNPPPPEEEYDDEGEDEEEYDDDDYEEEEEEEEEVRIMYWSVQLQLTKPRIP
jgi:hypothetical protein